MVLFLTTVACLVLEKSSKEVGDLVFCSRFLRLDVNNEPKTERGRGIEGKTG